MRTFGLTPGQQVEIITAYAAAMKLVNAVTPGPGWVTAGVFWLPSTATAPFEIIGLVSVNTNVLHARLWDVTAAAAVPNSEITIAATVETRVLSNPVPLTGGRLYRIEMEVIGAGGSGTLFTAGLTGVI